MQHLLKRPNYSPQDTKLQIFTCILNVISSYFLKQCWLNTKHKDQLKTRKIGARKEKFPNICQFPKVLAEKK